LVTELFVFAPTWEHRIVTHLIVCMCSVVATSDGYGSNLQSESYNIRNDFILTF